MRTMQFMPQLANFLYEKGAIYTVRRYEMKIALVEIAGAGICRRIPLGKIHKEELEPYVEMSGFHTLDEWWKMIVHFTRDREGQKYLYRIERVEDG